MADTTHRFSLRALGRAAAAPGVCGVAVLFGTTICVAAEPSGYPTGTTIYDPARAYNSFVLFPGGDDVTRLVDLTGNVVREWKYTGQPVSFIDPALVGGARGHIFVTLASQEGKGTESHPRPRADPRSHDGRRGRLGWRAGVDLRSRGSRRRRAAAS